tara:strand:- start:5835 stop:6656 length:822 start_codon:yes stop_codon:yes gene_type:complete
VKVSANELHSKLEKALLGLGLTQAAAKDASDMVCWLTLYGFDGIATLKTSLDLLEHCLTNVSAGTSPMSALQWDADTRTLSVDTQGGSALLFGNLWLEYSKSLATQHDEIAVLFENCPDVFLLMGYLPTLQSPGLDIDARAQQSATSPITYFKFRSGMKLPDVWQASMDSDVRESLTVCLTRPPTRIAEGSRREISVRKKAAADTKTDGRTSEMGITGAEYHQTAAELNTVYEQKLKTGIDIDSDLWDQLKHYGLATLVEADDASRMGAGPSD